MRTVVVVENVSLDGVMQGPGRPDEDEQIWVPVRPAGPRRCWPTTPRRSRPAWATPVRERRCSSAAHLSRPRWPLAVDARPEPVHRHPRSTPKYVVSRTLTEPLPHPASTLLSGGAVGAVRALKADGDPASWSFSAAATWYASWRRRTGRRVPADDPPGRPRCRYTTVRRHAYRARAGQDPGLQRRRRRPVPRRAGPLKPPRSSTRARRAPVADPGTGGPRMSRSPRGGRSPPSRRV